MQSHGKSFAQIESNWTIREGVSSLISNISCTNQSNFLLHFLKDREQFVKIFRDSRVFIVTMFAGGGRHILSSPTRWCKCLSV